MNKGVTWVSRFGEEMASYRYRAQVPAREVAKYNGFTTWINEGEADIVIFTKPVEEDIALAKKFKADGAKIVADFSDNHFHTVVAPVYRAFVEIADSLVCASDIMRQIIGEESGREACVIADPYEFPELTPHANGDDFLWFGHYRNFKEVVDVMPIMGERKLRVVTGPRIIPGTVPWTLPNLEKAFSLSNIVLLPTQEGAEYKSPNRLVNAIRQGCFAICMQHPAYFPFRNYVWVGHFPTGLRWSAAFVDELNDRVREAQDYVRDRYSPETVGKQWVSFLESL